ncbi:hypothetical protein GEMMAAP_03655 [Gemmatimonas phototrophica]|uniref:Uncharacterized protein n=1 Tax=Gemmatimonas phototrophica TaxID=1379270 RepID=A0A143BIC9_9BACT|nr:hypothetical protein GEMMAAP_03655 [Gemmatimonas phototrophica]
MLLAGCAKPDFTEAVTPEVATSLALLSQQRGDTVSLDITLGGGAPAALGSFTGEVVQPASWRFVQCDAQQPQALLACKAHDSTVRVAAAWAGGTHAGALVRLTYVRAGTALPSDVWTMSVSEAHSVRGQSLADSLQVRAQSVAGVVR